MSLPSDIQKLLYNGHRRDASIACAAVTASAQLSARAAALRSLTAHVWRFLELAGLTHNLCGLHGGSCECAATARWHRPALCIRAHLAGDRGSAPALGILLCLVQCLAGLRDPQYHAKYRSTQAVLSLRAGHGCRLTSRSTLSGASTTCSSTQVSAAKHSPVYMAAYVALAQHSVIHSLTITCLITQLSCCFISAVHRNMALAGGSRRWGHCNPQSASHCISQCQSRQPPSLGQALLGTATITRDLHERAKYALMLNLKQSAAQASWGPSKRPSP